MFAQNLLIDIFSCEWGTVGKEMVHVIFERQSLKGPILFRHFCGVFESHTGPHRLLQCIIDSCMHTNIFIQCNKVLYRIFMNHRE